MGEELTIALPKGRLLAPSVRLWRQAGLLHTDLEDNGRRLIHHDQESGIRYLICRASDVPTFVEYGAADLGVAGKDVIFERGKEVCELLDLGFGSCKFAVAVPRARLDHFQEGLGGYLARFGRLRVATKFPRVASRYLLGQGVPAEIIKLSGNIELAPLVGLADVIVDIVSTGRTLRENNLVQLAEITEATARLISNRVSYRLKYRQLAEVVGLLRGIAEGSAERHAEDGNQ